MKYYSGDPSPDLGVNVCNKILEICNNNFIAWHSMAIQWHSQLLLKHSYDSQNIYVYIKTIKRDYSHPFAAMANDIDITLWNLSHTLPL